MSETQRIHRIASHAVALLVVLMGLSPGAAGSRGLNACSLHAHAASTRLRTPP